MPSVLWCCWLGSRKGVWPVKTEWCDAGMVMCMGQGADLDIAKQMPLPLTIFCSSKSRLFLPSWFYFSGAGLPGYYYYYYYYKTTTVLWLSGFCPGLPGWAGTRKVKPKPIWFSRMRHSEGQWHQLGHMQICTLPQTDNHACTQPLSFLRARCPSCRPINSWQQIELVEFEPHCTCIC